MANIDAQRDAITAVRERFVAKYGDPDKFRYRIEPDKEGWSRVVCVDTRRKPISDIEQERYRPVITSAVVFGARCGTRRKRNVDRPRQIG